MKRVFLSGSENSQKEITPLLIKRCEVVKREEDKEESDYLLYVITPEESDKEVVLNQVIDETERHPLKILFLFEDHYPRYFDIKQLRSLDRIGELVERKGGHYLTTLDEALEIVTRV